VPGRDASVASPVLQVSALHFTFGVAAALIGSAGLIGLWALRKERAGRAAARSASVP
jgi:hypothetical protein